MSKPRTVQVERPVFYRPIERHWYRLVDYVQPRWHRFANSRAGFITGRSIYYLYRTARFLGGVIVVVGGFVLYTFLMFAFGGGKTRRR